MYSVTVGGKPLTTRYPWLLATFIDPSVAYAQLLKHRGRIVLTPQVGIHMEADQWQAIAFEDDDVKAIDVLLTLLARPGKDPVTRNLKREVLNYVQEHPDFSGLVKPDIPRG